MDQHYSRHRSLAAPGSCSSRDEEDEEEEEKEERDRGKIDYLQDPSLWWDPLPRPFRYADEILEELLEQAYTLLKSRENKRRHEANSNKPIPATEEATMVASLLETTQLEYVSSNNGVEYLLSCCGGAAMGLSCLQLKDNKLTTAPLDGPATSISAQCLTTGTTTDGEALLVAVGLSTDTGALGVIHVLREETLHRIAEIDEFSMISSVMLSSGGAHLAITGANNTESDAVQQTVVMIYSLPTEAWIQQLQAVQDTYVKPTLVHIIQSPSPLSPSPAIDSIQAMKRVQEKVNSNSLPTGSHHGLTKAYLSSRQNKFLAQRGDFLSEEEEGEKVLTRGPVLSYIHYWKGQYSLSPKAMAIKWSSSCQINLYCIQDKPKAPSTLTVPDQSFLQSSYITAMAVSSDTSFMITGLDTSHVCLFNLSTNTCWGVVALAPYPLAVTALCFIKEEWPNVMIVGGCEDGSVTSVTWEGLGHPRSNCMTKGYRINGSVQDLRHNVGLPSTVTSLHSDGRLIVWDWEESVPLGELLLPSPYSLFSSTRGTFVAASDVTAVIAKAIDSEQVGVFSWQLSTCEVLRKTLVNNSTAGKPVKLETRQSVFNNLIALIVKSHDTGE